MRAREPGTDALLAGGDHRSTLAVARSLARSGISFVVVGVGSRSAVAASRYVRRHFAGPDAGAEPEAFVDFLLDVARRYEARLVIPLNDQTLLACDRHRAAIEAEATLATAPSQAIRNVLDKRQNLETARRLGIPCPAEFTLERLEQVPELIARLGFPIVLKNPGPAADGAELDFRWLVASDEQELDRYLEQHCRSGAFPIFQELVTGTVRNVCCFAAAGEVLALHEYRSVRRWRGEGVFREVTPTTPELARHAERLLRELRWEGVAHLGFFVRETDGDVRYMETNGRFWASVEGSIRAGWDFPNWTYRYFAIGELPQPPPLEMGSRTCWRYGDLRALGKRLTRDEVPAVHQLRRARAVRDYVSGFAPGIHSDMFRPDDPLPELVEHWLAVRRAVARRRR